jgi:hypothetical protein
VIPTPENSKSPEKEAAKMDGAVRTMCSGKNWSPTFLYNCGHPKNKILTPDAMNPQDQRFLHKFQ